MKTTRFYIILFLIGICFSCKKKDYPEDKFENEAVYYFKGDINQQPVVIEAGNSDYYMFSSVQINDDNVYNFTGNLKKANCNDCGASLQVRINDFRVATRNTVFYNDSSLYAKNYPFATSSQPVYGLTFFPGYNKPAASYLWDFGDGNTSTKTTPYHYYTTAGNYKVCLTVKSADGCVSQICNEQKVGQFENVCKTAISSNTVSGNTIQFKQSTTGVLPIMSYLWDFGDGKSSSLPDPPHTYAVTGSYPVTLRVTDANRNVAIARYNVITANDVSSCAANYSVNATNGYTWTAQSLNLSSVFIDWTDEQGVVYSSVIGNQSPLNYFEILSVQEGEINEFGQKTKKLRVKFKATLYNGTTALNIDNADAVIAVAYK